jgi:hypothetical protein
MLSKERIVMFIYLFLNLSYSFIHSLLYVSIAIVVDMVDVHKDLLLAIVSKQLSCMQNSWKLLNYNTYSSSQGSSM